ncbi:hypothetical protein P879_06992 [Paragonimus westermani]|uniref:DUF4806 domain-containing protein n=1 Tax=Paragonimus westermani TaxID=34504 RepID=A0A8T0DG33_9TREM|nr:hypothetical protein P879_06992 [Paragonimus westermani]
MDTNTANSILRRPARNCKRPKRLIETYENDDCEPERDSPRPFSHISPKEHSLKPIQTSDVKSLCPAQTNLPITFVADMLEMLLIKLDESMAKQQELDRKLTLLLCRSKPGLSSNDSMSQEIVSDTGKFSPAFDFPLRTVDDFERLECTLRNQNTFDELVESFSMVGGHSVEQLVKNLLDRMFVLPLALQINWVGSNNKKALQSSKCFELICSACTKQKENSDSIRRIVEHHVRSWFRLILERERRRLIRSMNTQNTLGNSSSNQRRTSTTSSDSGRNPVKSLAPSVSRRSLLTH